MKKTLGFIAIFLVLMMFTGNFTVFANEDEKTFVYNDFYYTEHSRNNIDGIEITGYRGDSSFVKIPETIDNKPVISIGAKCFENNSIIMNFSFPESIIHFTDYAFEGTGWLKNYPDDFVIVNGILIKYKAADKKIAHIVVPDDVKVINYGAFNFYKFKTISLPKSLEAIYPDAFYQCEELTKIFIPKNVYDIRLEAFKNCFSLEKIEVDEENLKYSSSDGVLLDKEQETLLFCPQARFSHFNVPETVKTIYRDAFSNCTNISSITLPKGLTEIQDWAFYRCFSLTEISIPNSVTKIGYWSFGECKNLKKVKFGSKIKNIDEMAFISCESLKEVKITDDVEFIGEYAFGKIFNWKDNNQGTLSDVKGFKFKIDNKGNVNHSKSAIVKYAAKHNIKYTFANDFERELGDINGNGKIEAADARLALRASAKLITLSPFEEIACDVNYDGKVTSSDARKILRVAAKIDNFELQKEPADN